MDRNFVFITGNPAKAAFLERLLGSEVEHSDIDIDEIQSLDSEAVATAKAEAAYRQMGRPVLIDDVSLRCTALGRLPGPFTKWFETELGLDGYCRLLDGYQDRTAEYEVVYALHDGKKVTCFNGVALGRIADTPKGKDGFGFDTIFIHDGTDKTRAELSHADQDRLGARTVALEKLKAHLSD